MKHTHITLPFLLALALVGVVSFGGQAHAATNCTLVDPQAYAYPTTGWTMAGYNIDQDKAIANFYDITPLFSTATSPFTIIATNFGNSANSYYLAQSAESFCGQNNADYCVNVGMFDFMGNTYALKFKPGVTAAQLTSIGDPHWTFSWKQGCWPLGCYGDSGSGSGGGMMDSLSGTCIPPGPPTVTLSATPTAVDAGNSSLLSWSSTNATSCTSSDFATGNATSGSVSVTPASPSTTYHITCTGSGGSISGQTTVTVNATSGVSDCVPGGTMSICNGSFCNNYPAPAGGTITTSPAQGSASATAVVTDSVGANHTITASCTYNSALAGWFGPTNCTAAQSQVIDGTTYTVNVANTGNGTTSNGNLTPSNTPACVIQKPDLTASNVTQTSAVATVPITLSASVTNIGPLSTGAGFSDLFQETDSSLDINGNPTGVVNDVGTYPSIALGPGAQNTPSFSYKFPTQGTSYVRVCADKANQNDANGVIAESNENNNCSSNWTAVTVNPVGTLQCDVLPTQSGTAPFSVTYKVVPSTESPYTWTSGGSTVSGVSGATYSPTAYGTGTYNVSVAPKAGSSYTQVTCPQVSVSSGACANPTAKITPSTTRVNQNATNGSNRITFTVSNGSGLTAGACYVTGPGYQSEPLPTSSCNLSPGTYTVTTKTPPITAQSTYQVTCNNVPVPNSSVTVNVIPNTLPF